MKKREYIYFDEVEIKKPANWKKMKDGQMYWNAGERDGWIRVPDLPMRWPFNWIEQTKLWLLKVL